PFISAASSSGALTNVNTSSGPKSKCRPCCRFTLLPIFPVAQYEQLTFEFTRSRKRAKPAVASRVQRRVRPHGEIEQGAWACCLSEVHGNEESRCRKDLLVRIGLRPRRSALGVVPELAEFLRAAAGFGDLRGPLDGGFARREFQDTEAAVE